jgi:hypothetical protein
MSSFWCRKCYPVQRTVMFASHYCQGIIHIFKNSEVGGEQVNEFVLQFHRRFVSSISNY